MSFMYMASPYTHPDPAVRRERYETALSALAYMLQHRHWAYSPIVHCHHLSIEYNLPHDSDFWRTYDETMIRSSTGILVLMIDGWRTSKGVTSEIAFAKEIGKPIGYLKPLPKGSWQWTNYE